MGGTIPLKFPWAVTLLTFIGNASVGISGGIFTTLTEDFNGFPQSRLVNAVMIL
jgi:hypothetical protein